MLPKFQINALFFLSLLLSYFTATTVWLADTNVKPDRKLLGQAKFPFEGGWLELCLQ
jgi:hypothetical protein